MANMLRSLPSLSDILESPPLKSVLRRVNQNVVVARARQALDDLRLQVQTTATGMNFSTPLELAQKIADWISAEEQPELRPVINATGILLHPGLGGPPLAGEAIQAAAAVAGSYASLDVDLVSGEATERTAAAELVLEQLTGAEAAAIVNNHAGAALLTLAGLAQGREVLVSRGELVEFPGSHRLPEIIAASGGILREVGTTNSTRIADYAAAITERSALLLRVHVGKASSDESRSQPPLTELVALARQHNLPIVHELGNGSLIDMSRFGIAGELSAGESLKAGADLVLLSGERLLGGPQCGLIVGRRSMVEKLARHPLMAALRIDKLSLAALIATLRLYQDPHLAGRSVPLLSLLSTPLENLRNRAQRLAPQIEASGVARVEIVESQATVGCGTLKSQAIATVCLSVTPLAGPTQLLDASLRTCQTPVFGRREGERLLLDLRTVLPRQDLELVAAFDSLAAAAKAQVAAAAEIPTID